MKSVVLPDGREIVIPRLPKNTYMKLRSSGKEINRKKLYNKNMARQIIREQLSEEGMEHDV